MPWADKHRGIPCSQLPVRGQGLREGHPIPRCKALASQSMVSADKSMGPGALVRSVRLSPEVELCRVVRTGGIQGPTLWGGTSCSRVQVQRLRPGAGRVQDTKIQHPDRKGGLLALVGGSPSSSIFALLKIRRTVTLT